MKTLIVYATKYGATKKIAERIAALIPGAALCDLDAQQVPKLEGVECVVIGGSLYAGALRKPARAFAAERQQALLDKRLGLFLSGMQKEPGAAAFSANFPATLLDAARAKAALGGIFDPGKANAFERLVMRMVAKQSAYEDTISDERIRAFVDALLA